VKVIRRRRPGDDPDKPTPPGPEEWVEIDHYPLLEAERIRGARVFRTKNSPLRYRIVMIRPDRIPAVIAIANERRIRFGSHPTEFGFIRTGERKVTEWLTDLPDFKNRDVIHSNPDFVTWDPDTTGTR
jgi:hypothetical protein